MRDDAITGDELIEQMKPFGNLPVVWLGPTGEVRDAVSHATLVHTPKKLIGLKPATTQSNVGDVPTTPQVQKVRDDLRVAKNTFATEFSLYVDGERTKNQFEEVKRNYDTVIARCLDVLAKF
jgi:hypothetical protein